MLSASRPPHIRTPAQHPAAALMVLLHHADPRVAVHHRFIRYTQRLQGRFERHPGIGRVTSKMQIPHAEDILQQVETRPSGTRPHRYQVPLGRQPIQRIGRAPDHPRRRGYGVELRHVLAIFRVLFASDVSLFDGKPNTPRPAVKRHGPRPVIGIPYLSSMSRAQHGQKCLRRSRFHFAIRSGA